MKRIHDSLLLVTVSICSIMIPLSAQAQPGRFPDEAAFMAWAKGSLTPVMTVSPAPSAKDLESLGRMIGDKPLVALTEGVHFAAEPLEFRNRVLQYLVQRKGFTAIAIESGVVEGHAVYDYVRGGEGDLAKVMRRGFSYAFDKLPQNEALVRWLREYNADPRHVRKVNFYGFDVPGSVGNPRGTRNVDTALVEALDYLAHVDNASAAEFHARLDRVMTNLHFDWYSPDGPNYSKLTQVERDTLTSAIADLIALLERSESRYTAASTAEDYDWAYRAAIGARQADNWLRVDILVGRQPSVTEMVEAGFRDIRERAMADNIDWAVKREGPAGKVLVFANTIHLTAMPLVTRWIPRKGTEPGPEKKIRTMERDVAGTYLRRRFGDRLVIVGNLIGKGEAACASVGYRQILTPAPAKSSTGIAGAVGVPHYLLDLRSAPASAATWLDEPRPLSAPYQYEYEISVELPLRKAFDILFYLDTVTPACVQ